MVGRRVLTQTQTHVRLKSETCSASFIALLSFWAQLRACATNPQPALLFTILNGSAHFRRFCVSERLCTSQSWYTSQSCAAIAAKGVHVQCTNTARCCVHLFIISVHGHGHAEPGRSAAVLVSKDLTNSCFPNVRRHPITKDSQRRRNTHRSTYVLYIS